MGGKSVPKFPLVDPEPNDGSDSNDEGDLELDSEGNEVLGFDEMTTGADIPASQQHDVSDPDSQVPRWMPTSAEEAQFDEMEASPTAKVYSLDDVPKFVQAKAKLVHVNLLKWDTRLKLGQVRALNPTTVNEYAAGLLQRPPRTYVNVLCRATSGMHFIFCVVTTQH